MLFGGISKMALSKQRAISFILIASCILLIAPVLGQVTYDWMVFCSDSSCLHCVVGHQPSYTYNFYAYGPTTWDACWKWLRGESSTGSISSYDWWVFCSDSSCQHCVVGHQPSYAYPYIAYGATSYAQCWKWLGWWYCEDCGRFFRSYQDYVNHFD